MLTSKPPFPALRYASLLPALSPPASYWGELPHVELDRHIFEQRMIAAQSGSHVFTSIAAAAGPLPDRTA
eukprot:scaffold272067_cov28-Tisochrysis_lutea.AAC.1